MNLVKHWRALILITLVVFSVFLIHPFSEEGLVVTSTRGPTSKILQEGDRLLSVNGREVESLSQYSEVISDIEPNSTVNVKVKRETFPYFYEEIDHTFLAREENNETRLAFDVGEGGGMGFYLSGDFVEANKIIIESDTPNALRKLRTRFDMFGVKDYSFQKSGDKIVLVTVSSPLELRRLIEKEGGFEARIGNKTYFSNEDIKDLCRTGSGCERYLHQVRDVNETTAEMKWTYGFQLTLTEEVGKRFSNITDDLTIASCSGGRCVLNETIDYFLDGEKIGSTEIDSLNKGEIYTEPSVSEKVSTQSQAMESRRELSALLMTRVDAEVQDVQKKDPSHQGLFEMTPYIILGIFLTGAAISVFLLKDKKVILGAGLGLAEIVVIFGIYAGLDQVLSLNLLLAIIASAVISSALFAYSSYYLKKKPSAESVVTKFSRKITKVWVVSLAISFLLMFFVSFFIPLFLYFSISLVLTKGIFFKYFKEFV